MARPITSFKCLTLDCYGTLVDWESGIFQALQPLVHRLPPSHPLRHNRLALLRAFTRHEGLVQAARPTLLYSAVLACAHAALAAELGVALGAPSRSNSDSDSNSDSKSKSSSKPTADRNLDDILDILDTLDTLDTLDPESTAFGSSVGNWPVYPDTIASLKRLHRHFRLVILSNVDRASFARTRSLMSDAPLDAICLAEDIGSYKPDLRNFRFVVDRCARLGVLKEDILHTAQSLKHDHEPAKQVGLTSAWIARSSGSSVSSNPPPPASSSSPSPSSGGAAPGPKPGSQESAAVCESVMGGDEAAYAARVAISWRFSSLEDMADFVDAEAARLAGSEEKKTC